MTFRGLFIGIDRYNSPRISWLSCARNDAIALHALFSDNLGGNNSLLVDEAATRENIEHSLCELQNAQEDDVVLIYFSGHGSETHELVTYNADIDQLSETAIPLDSLLEWFSKIPSKQLICILDCCFSGGMGSKVLQFENKAKGIESEEDILNKLSGEGRIIITASSATQPAWENSRLGHGFLTYHLIEGLKGAEEIVDSGKIPFYRLFDYLDSKVTAAAASIGKEQHPNIRGTIDKALYWPTFLIGPRYAAAFPETSKAPITSDLNSLQSYRFPEPLIKAWASSITSLNQLQLDAVNQFGIFQGNHLIVSAPTSSGKTMIGELAALKGLFERRRAIFLFPLKALVNDKYKHFNKIYGEFGFKTIRTTGDLTDDVPLLLKGQYDICLMTYEKFTALILSNPHILEQVGTVVVDEVQMIADKNRGANLEFILTLIRIRRTQSIEPQIIALSAVIGDTNGLERWLDARLLKKPERPVPLDEGIVSGFGSLKYIQSDDNTVHIIDRFICRQIRNGGNQEWVIPLVRKLVSEGKQVIVFREKTGEAKGTGIYLAENLGLASAQSVLDSLPIGDPSIMSEALRTSLRGGVAIHTSHLAPEERLVIEESFRKPNSEIRVISATTTLAMGINTPAEAVIIVGLEHPGDPPTQYSIAEYKNMVGRAGRLGFANRGASYLLALSPREEYSHWETYVQGVPEDLTSRFFDTKTDPRSLIVKVLTSAKRLLGNRNRNVGLSANDIIDFLEGSFGAFQQKQRYGSWNWNREELLGALNNLETYGLISRGENGAYQLTELGWIAGHGGVEVESITRLVEALQPLHDDDITDTTLIAAAQLTLELENVLFPLNSRGVKKETQSWQTELQNQGVSFHVLNLMIRFGPDAYTRAARLKKAAACLLWITDIPLGEIENILTRHGGRFDGAAGPIRSASSRTHDVLYIVGAVAVHLHQGLDLTARLNKLFTRLEVGVPSSIFEIARFMGNQLTRGDYQILLKAGITSLDALEIQSDEEILNLLNNNREKLEIIRTSIIYAKTENSGDSLNYPLIPTYQP